VNNTTNTSDLVILLPIINGPLEDCYKQVCFFGVQFNIDFARLVPPGIQGLTIVRAKFYIKLLQSTSNMTNGDNQPYCLTSWLSNTDLCAISVADLTHDVQSHNLQDGPINLLCPKFNLNLTKTDLTTTKTEISFIIVYLVTALACNSLFNQHCLVYSKEPNTAQDHTQQTYSNANGTQYFQVCMNITFKLLQPLARLLARKSYQSAFAMLNSDKLKVVV
jgi:hypothetical protein